MSNSPSMRTLTAGPSPTNPEIPYSNLQAVFDVLPVVFARWVFSCFVFIFVIPTGKDAEICGILTALFIWKYDSDLTNIISWLEEMNTIFEIVKGTSPSAAIAMALLIPLSLIGLGTVFATMKGMWFGRFLICGLSIAGAALSWSADADV